MFSIKKIFRPSSPVPNIGPNTICVLGTGCTKCNMLAKQVSIALEQLGRDNKVEHITDIAHIAALGVLTTPALMIGTNVVSSGRTLSVEEIQQLLVQYLPHQD